jgi:hypothetical protein
MCEKKNLIEMKNLFFKNWFSNPEQHNVSYHYMMTFKNQRDQIQGNSYKRYFYDKYFTDDCINEFFLSNMHKILQADKNFDKEF